MYRDFEECSNNELRVTPDLVVVFRVNFLWLSPDLIGEIVEPVAICKLRFLRYQMPRLKADARDLRGADFYWRDLSVLDDHVLDRVKAHLQQENEIHLCLRHLEHVWRADCAWE